MGLFDKLKKGEPQKKMPSILKDKVKQVEKSPEEVELVPVEEDTLAREILKPKVTYIKKISISTYADLKNVSEEISAGNIVIADLTPLEPKPDLLSKVAEQLRMTAETFGWDIAKLCKNESKVIITPPNIKIFKE
ncbi:cell division protein SepF [Pyrococcus abyssi]|uniref:Cell division protein SepF n=1 Tax=Pyrococcus abyssi (strain GE5 / Orsay) TaxID=272844 RepID=G8ZHX9_PYRAB|nr:cell division protein SepF [Pyrococcus abyssi]CCE69722.1 TPA: hypothetical protein PAB2117 [Pyrococcus abyssi GE5]